MKKLYFSAIMVALAAGCHRERTPDPTRGAADAAGSAGVSPRATGNMASGNAADGGAAPAVRCRVEPAGGVAIPILASSGDVRIGAGATKALVTWLEPPYFNGHGRRVVGRLYDGEAHALVGPDSVFEDTKYGDVIPSGAVPLDVSGRLSAVLCVNSAPEGILRCKEHAAEGKPRSLLQLSFVNDGPQEPGIAAVAGGGNDIVVFLPEGGSGEVALFSTSVSASRKTHHFASALGKPAPHADALAATMTAADEATVVYRLASEIRGRRAGLDERWRGRATALSAPKSSVGAPVVGANGGPTVALFSERASARDPWRITMAEWTGDEVRRRPLFPDGDPTQAPALLATDSPACFLVSWVAGSGTQTKTKLARMCDGRIDDASALTLSRDGVEGGRAALAKSADSTFVVWQEFPRPEPSVLRVANLICR